jgi:periplasmic protein TonB
MFNDTLHTSWDEHSRRGVTTLTSFGLQALAIGLLLLVPLLRPISFPLLRPLSTPVSPGQPRAEVSSVRPRTSNAIPSNSADIVFKRSSSLPFAHPPSVDDGPPQISSIGSYVPGTITTGDPHGMANWLTGGSQPVLPMAPPPNVTAHPLRLSHISEGNLVHKVQPAYPALARAARIEGMVQLQAVISKQGTIENLRVVSGHPMLACAAIEAVSQWRYRPYILNNETVEVETEITVNFSISGN